MALKFLEQVCDREAERISFSQAPKNGFILLMWLVWFYAVILFETLGRGVLDFSGVLTG